MGTMKHEGRVEHLSRLAVVWFSLSNLRHARLSCHLKDNHLVANAFGNRNRCQQLQKIWFITVDGRAVGHIISVQNCNGVNRRSAPLGFMLILLMLCNYSALLCNNAVRNTRVCLPAIERQCPLNAPINAKESDPGYSTVFVVLHIFALVYASLFS